jgi:hypothetical protein
MMCDADFLKETMELFILTTPISLHSDDFSTKFLLNKLLKIKKDLINLRALFKEIYPGKLSIVINKSYKICMFANRNRCWTPYVKKHLF